MGLDQYLLKKTYVRNWDHLPPEKRHKITVEQGGKPSQRINTERITHIEEEVGYWRKFNALHNWFVENVQDGNDNCQPHYVSQSNFEELLQVLETVLQKRGQVGDENVPVAESLLPTREGFFFGGVEYDEYYYNQIEQTINIVKECISNDYADYYYQSSW